MGRGRAWTTHEDEFLVANAGRLTKRQIAERLRRTNRAVEAEARRLRQRGVDVCLRCHRSTMAVCPACGRMRTALGESGLCGPCMAERRLERIQADTARLIAMLPADERSLYAQTEAEVESSAPERPKRPRVPQGAPYRVRARLEDRYDADVEAWEEALLTRRIKAAQKRKERIRHKVEALAEKNKNFVGFHKNSR